MDDHALPAGRWAAVHAAPYYMDRDRTVDKVAALTAEAAHAGAQIVAFGESFIPGFPTWCLVRRPIDQHTQFERLRAEAVDIPGPVTARLAEIARKNNVVLSIGLTERSPISVGGLYNTNVVFDRAGRLASHHRKLMGTWAERLVWAPGDGAGLGVLGTDLGVMGVLICGENTNPLARYALMAQGEQLHVATWPSCWPFARAAPTGGYARWIELRTAAHAFEAKVHCLAVASFLAEDAILGCSAGDREAETILRETPPAVSLALGPTAELIGNPIQGEEGILYADVDVNGSVEAKQAHDVVCGYQRFDVFSFGVNRRRDEPVMIVDEPAALRSSPAQRESPTATS